MFNPLAFRAMAEAARNRRPMLDGSDLDEDENPDGEVTIGPRPAAAPVQFLSRPGDPNGASPKERMLGGLSFGGGKLSAPMRPDFQDPDELNAPMTGNRMLASLDTGSAHAIRPLGGRDPASTMAYVSWKANNPGKDPNEFWAAREGHRGAGGDVASYSSERPGQDAATLRASLRNEALRGNPQAVQKLEYLANNPEFERQVFGGTPVEREEQAMQMAERQMYNKHELALSEMRMKGEQQRVINEHNKQVLELDKQVKLGTLDQNKANAIAAQSMAAAKQKLAEVAQAAEERRGGQQLALQEKELGMKYGPKPLTEEEKADKALDRRMKTAQVGVAEAAAEREQTGEVAPKQQAANLKAANARAQELVDKGADPSEAADRAAREFDIPPGKVQAGTISDHPQAVQQRLQGLGFQNADDAFKAGLDEVVREDPQLRSALGGRLSSSADRWFFHSAPMQNPTYKAAVKDRVVRKLIERGVPAQYAGRIVNERVSKE